MTTANLFADLSFPWLKQAVDVGVHMNQFKTVIKGLFHQYGIGYTKSYNEAQNCFRSAGNNDVAWFCASKLESSAEFPNRNPDFVKAFQCLRVSALLGLDYAQFELGSAYEAGRGTGRDLEEAKHWYQRAADSGISEALVGVQRCEFKILPRFSPEASAHNFVRMFTQVLCGQQAALDSLRTAAIKDRNPLAQACLSALVSSSLLFHTYKRRLVEVSDDALANTLEKASMPWLRKNAEEGCPVAATFLGMLLQKTRYRSFCGPSDGQKWTLKAANNGCPLAQLAMAESEILHPEISWLQRAAAQENSLAEHILAECYRYGKGVAADYQKYTELTKLAADHGYIRG